MDRSIKFLEFSPSRWTLFATKAFIMQKSKMPPQPIHVSGMHKAEEMALGKREPGRGGNPYRTARDSTGINPEHHKPIHPAMPNILPA
jgi:hypothetical protein